MKKFIFIFFLCLSFNVFILTSIAEAKVIKRGFHTTESLNLTPDTKYTIQNNSFNERSYVLIFDTSQNLLQTIRLWPQSQKYDLVPLQAGYRIIIAGDGEVDIS